MEQIYLNENGNNKLSLHLFEIENPKGIIQIIHGMEEHQERYEDFALFLNQNGYNVITSDLRGHGSTASKLGYFGPKNGYKMLIKDQKDITAYIKNRFSNLKVILFAHSMGTIIARNVLADSSSDYDKVILSGYPNPQPAAGIGIFLTNVIRFFHNPQYHSKFVENMALGGFNKTIKHAHTPFDWICTNEDIIAKYIDDPYCGHGFTVQAFNDLFHLIKRMGNTKTYQNVKTNLEIFMICGVDDPCTGFSSGRTKSINLLTNAGFNINHKEYDGMRHEILNEKNNIIVYNDVLNFINK